MDGFSTLALAAGGLGVLAYLAYPAIQRALAKSGQPTHDQDVATIRAAAELMVRLNLSDPSGLLAAMRAGVAAAEIPLPGDEVQP